MDRPWDKNNKYTKGFLKDYKHWALEVDYRQSTLGCFVIFSKIEVERISELPDEVLLELKKVMSEVESALLRSPFKPNRFNYLQLGNKLHRLHFRGIPRYRAVREFLNKEWVDEDFATIPVWSKNDEGDSTISAIKETLEKYLS